jgi:hypothetical protein
MRSQPHPDPEQRVEKEAYMTRLWNFLTREMRKMGLQLVEAQKEAKRLLGVVEAKDGEIATLRAQLEVRFSPQSRAVLTC